MVTLKLDTARGRDQGPDGVRQVEDLGVDHVGGRHAAAEDHGDKDQDGQEVVELVLPAGQDVAHDGGQQHAQDGADGGDADGHPQEFRMVSRWLHRYS